MVAKPGAIKKLWWRWKSLRLPWRRQWLVGFDLSGNTFWEFQDQLNAGRVRRIARYPGKIHLGDVNLSPQWVQWLRHTRTDPPSINEQQLDEIRRAQMKRLAAEADARWAAKPSALDRPKAHQRVLESLPRASAHPDVQPKAEPQDTANSAVGNLAAQIPHAHAQQTKGRITEEEVAAAPAAELDRQQTPASQQPTRKVKEFTGYKLGKEGEQQPDSWVPKAVPRRR